MKLAFVGVGPMRAGTTWLHAALALHPRVALPREKETFYFDRYFDRGPAWYEAHFRGAPEGAVFGEIGASYFHSPAARARIHDAAPDALVLVNVRDPVERAFSTYLHLKKTRALPERLAEAVDAEPEILDSGAYSVHLPAWESRFGRDRVELVPLEAIRARPHDVLARILARLGLPPLDPSIDLSQPRNEGFVPRSEAVQRIRAKVFRYLADHHHFRALDAVRAAQRAFLRLTGMERPRERRMTADERAFLEARLRDERAFLADRLPSSRP